MTERNGLKFCNTASRNSFCDTRWHEEVCKKAENYCQFQLPQLLLKIYCNVYLDLISNSWAHWHSSQSLHDDTKKCAFCFFFLFLNNNQSLHGVSSNCLSARWKCCLWKSKLEVSSAFRLLAGRWKTASIVEKKRKNSTDRKLTRRNSTEVTIWNLTHNSVKYH